MAESNMHRKPALVIQGPLPAESLGGTYLSLSQSKGTMREELHLMRADEEGEKVLENGPAGVKCHVICRSLPRDKVKQDF